jgi:hypothetical protein
MSQTTSLHFAENCTGAGTDLELPVDGILKLSYQYVGVHVNKTIKELKQSLCSV